MRVAILPISSLLATITDTIPVLCGVNKQFQGAKQVLYQLSLLKVTKSVKSQLSFHVKSPETLLMDTTEGARGRGRERGGKGE